MHLMIKIIKLNKTKKKQVFVAFEYKVEEHENFIFRQTLRSVLVFWLKEQAYKVYADIWVFERSTPVLLEWRVWWRWRLKALREPEAGCLSAEVEKGVQWAAGASVWEYFRRGIAFIRLQGILTAGCRTAKIE